MACFYSHGNNEPRVDYMMRLVLWAEYLDELKTVQLWGGTVRMLEKVEEKEGLSY